MSEKKGINEVQPGTETFFPPVPTATTRFFRTCILWQLFRFVSINIKMIRMIAKSHH